MEENNNIYTHVGEQLVREYYKQAASGVLYFLPLYSETENPEEAVTRDGTFHMSEKLIKKPHVQVDVFDSLTDINNDKEDR